MSEMFKRFCKEQGIKQEPSGPYAPQANGRAERSWRTVVEMDRTLLMASGLK
jgi:transposase InsO family protein